MSQCTAKSKRTQQPCQRPAMVGRTVCYHHGGMIPRGIALPQTTTGRYSKHIPTRLLATYEQAKSDPELLALRDEVALIDSRLTDLIKRVETGESGHVWRQVREAFRAFKDATAKQDTNEARSWLVQLESLITRGVADEMAWLDVRVTLEQRRKLVESERKRLVEMQQMVSADEAALLVRTLTEAVREHVRDPDALRAIVAAFGRVAPLAAGD
jgi:hypothetical protein